MVKITRCGWCKEDAVLIRYHDEEWGRPIADSTILFEKLILEIMQAGLSWRTVLAKRSCMHKQFFGFDPQCLARCDEREVRFWMQDQGLIRNQQKLESLIENARAALRLSDFSDFVWSFVDMRPIDNLWPNAGDVPATTATAKQMSRELKRHGFKFIGPIICYSFMQSAGLVNDHLKHCVARKEFLDHEPDS